MKSGHAGGIVERLFAEAVAGQKQFLVPVVPDGQGEHPVEVFGRTLFDLFVQVDNYFGVAVGGEAMPLFHQVFAEFPVIVNLAVKNDLNAAVFIAQRLRAAAEIDDTQAAMA